MLHRQYIGILEGLLSGSIGIVFPPPDLRDLKVWESSDDENGLPLRKCTFNSESSKPVEVSNEFIHGFTSRLSPIRGLRA